ncbi:unnamed protein product, partial [Medioppia subpectinata]
KNFLKKLVHNYEKQTVKSESFEATKVAVKWSVDSYGTVTHNGNYTNGSNHSISFAISNEKLCQNILPANGVRVIIFVESMAMNVERRDTVRETWAHQTLQHSLGFRVVFVLGLHSKAQRAYIQISFAQMPGYYFPPYCSGFGYGFRASVAERLYSIALTIPYFHFEDVFITGFCRQKANISVEDTKHLTLRPVLRPSDGLCAAFSDQRINGNEMSSKEIRQLWSKPPNSTQRLLCPKIIKNG